MLQEWSILPGNKAPNLTTMQFNWATFNGLAAPLIPHIEVQQGQRVRIRFRKEGDLRLISHRDLLRLFERLFRRGKLRFPNGFRVMLHVTG